MKNIVNIFLFTSILCFSASCSKDWFGRRQMDATCTAHWQCSSNDNLVCRTTIENPNLSCQIDNCESGRLMDSVNEFPFAKARISDYDIWYYDDGCIHKMDKKRDLWYWSRELFHGHSSS